MQNTVHTIRRSHALHLIAIFTALVPGLGWCQNSYGIDRVVREAMDSYPAVRVSTEQVSAAAAAINVARTAYLPRIDFLAQANRATRNNVFGMLLPQSTLPGISGPPLATNSLTSVWGSAVGFQVAWEPFDFGLRQANVGHAEAGRRAAESAAARTRFEVGAQAADAFLTVVAAQETAVAAQAGVERSRILTEMVDALVKSELRPGADFSRARAELAVAQNQLIQAQSAIDVARATLAQYVNADPRTISIQGGSLLRLPTPPALPDAPPAEHPLLAEQQSVVAQIQASQKVLNRSYFPRFLMQGASYARGTGALPDGMTLGGVHGLGPNIHNWGAGLTVTFPAFDLPSIRARREVEVSRERSAAARYEQIERELNAAAARAQAQLDGARRIAGNTPVQLEAARATEQQMSARYRAGLGTLIELAEAQRLVTQAQIDDALARLGIWRAMLQVAVAQGDLDPFLQEAGR